MENIKLNNLLSTIEKISECLNENRALIGNEFIQNFENQKKKIIKSGEEILNENRIMKIGVVGQVKAGKSSFLNALLFDGQDILPKAATPMTAALTKLCFSENPYAKVVFYTKEDWQLVEKNASLYDKELERLKEIEIKERTHRNKRFAFKVISDKNSTEDNKVELSLSEISALKTKINEEYRACKELVDMLNDNYRLQVLSKLDEEEIIHSTTIQDDIKEYVGANGLYTPIVKWIELGLDNKLLEGFEVIDTPGMGDPIISREIKTKDFLMQCDLVFLLSYSGQFLTKQDALFISKTLPNDSIGYGILIGSKFDSALLDYSSRKKVSIGQAIGETYYILSEAAEQSIRELLENTDNAPKILQRLKESNPAFISAIAYGMAKKLDSRQKFSKEEQIIFNNLESRFDGVELNSEFLYEFSNIEAVKHQTFKKIYTKKEDILKERSENFIKEQKAIIFNYLENIHKELNSNKDILAVGDIDQLKQNILIIKDSISRLTTDVKIVFSRLLLDIEKQIYSLIISIKKSSTERQYLDINVEKKQFVVHKDNKKDKRFWQSLRTWDEVTDYSEVNIVDMLRNFHNLNVAIEAKVNQIFNSLFSSKSVKKQLLDILLKEFESNDIEFRENDILGAVSIGIERLTIPQVQIDVNQYTSLLTNSIGKKNVRDAEISEAMVKFNSIVKAFVDYSVEQIKGEIQRIQKQIEEQGESFITNVVSILSEKINLIELQLLDKENSLKKYDEAILQLIELKQHLGRDSD